MIFNFAIKSIKIIFVMLFLVFLSACTQDQESGLIEGGELLHFVVQEGKIHNEFYRQGPVAAHMVLTSGLKPRLIVAFPAGNSGVSLWFKQAIDPVQWQNVESMTGIHQYNAGALYGIEAFLTVSATELTLDTAVLGNIRTIRDHMHGVKIPETVETSAAIINNKVTWSRNRLDGQGGYKLLIEVIDGELIRDEASTIIFKANKDRKLRLRMVALTGDTPLTPIESDALLNQNAADDLLSRQILSFLTYKEKMLAGSWRFLTYFGRDTLLSLRMLMPVLKPEAIEAGLGSVIERLNSNGDVAHEEDIGEFAILRHLQEKGDADNTPIFDYKMVDDDYMLSMIVAHYLLSHKDRAADFLARKTVRGQTYGDALVGNMKFVLKTAESFANSPVARNLVAIKQGVQVGEWRDSNEGLGGGRYAFNVNAIFVPAALEAIVRLKNSAMLDLYMADETLLSRAESYGRVWREKAPELFKVSLSATAARQSVVDHAARLNLPAGPALSSLNGAGVGYYGVSLDEHGKVIPIINSDVGFMMLFNTPTAEDIEYALRGIMRPFPAGLMTPVGLVVANAVYAPEELKKIFTNGHYHGSVIWSWQQALLAAGFERQLMRDDLPEATRQLITGYQNNLWQVIKEGQKVKTSELWSWTIKDNKFTIAPFGQGQDHSTESNAAQLWSTVYLAVQAPDIIKSKGF
ncbi:MAG: hypothetical protein COB49_04725 [Alphaproteobacteria bacterium]|nr:MAG: hypothetical protein COB49_04725 [Alphaproteobacteria bacterium]